MANQDDYIKTAMRLPKELHDSLLDAARKSHKSMNAEIIHRLSQSFNLSLDSDVGNLFSFLENLQSIAEKKGFHLSISLENIKPDDSIHKRRSTD